MTGPTALEKFKSTMVERLGFPLIKLFILFILSFKILAADYDKIDIQDDATANSYLKTHPEHQPIIQGVFNKIMETKVGIIKFHEGTSTPVLFIHGLDKRDFYPEWVKPMGKLISMNRPSYMFTWHPKDSVGRAQGVLTQSIRALLKKYEGQELTILAHSAGGVVAILSIHDLKSEEKNRIKLHTIASPLYGYRAPPIFAYFGVPFAGLASIQIGRGYSSELKDIKLSCSHWVTNNCDLDKHACNHLGIIPQLGPAKAPAQLPCGNDNIIRLADESHSSSVYRVLKEVFKDASK